MITDFFHYSLLTRDAFSFLAFLLSRLGFTQRRRADDVRNAVSGQLIKYLTLRVCMDQIRTCCDLWCHRQTWLIVADDFGCLLLPQRKQTEDSQGH